MTARRSGGMVAELQLGFMGLIPRWSVMTDDSKALVKNISISVLVLLIGGLLLRAFVGYILLGLIAWAVWSALKRK